MSKIVSLLGFGILVAAAAAFGTLYMPGPWYEALARPTWTPPNWVFASVWSVLYVMIALAGWRVWNTQSWMPLVGVWLIGLVFNAAWSWLMFGQHQIDLALVDIVALLVTISTFIVLAWPIDRIAALLFVPYAVWISFATSLNLAIWQLNS